MVPPTLPQTNVSYPLRVGKSLRPPPHRSVLSLKFQYLPSHIATEEAGIISRDDDKCTIHLPTTDGSAMTFSGSRPSKGPSTLNEYVLIFANGQMWLERNTDVFYGIRGGVRCGKLDVPGPGGGGGSDSWWTEESGSPITPETDHVDEVNGKLNGKSSGAGAGAGAGAVPGPTVPRAMAGKSVHVAGKTVAGKGLTTNTNVEEEMEVVEEGSSSDGDSSGSDDSDSDSDSSSQGSQDYTDRSSDEE